MDWTPLIQQALVDFLSGSWWAEREHTQEECRYIAAFAGGKREHMP